MSARRKLDPLLVILGQTDRDLFIYGYGENGALTVTPTNTAATSRSIFDTMADVRAEWPEDIIHDDGAA